MVYTALLLAVCAASNSSPPTQVISVTSPRIVDRSGIKPLGSGIIDLGQPRMLLGEFSLQHSTIDSATGQHHPIDLDVLWRTVDDDGTVMGGLDGWYGHGVDRARVTLMSWDRATGVGEYHLQIPVGGEEPSKFTNSEHIPSQSFPYLLDGAGHIEIKVGESANFSPATANTHCIAESNIDFIGAMPGLLVRINRPPGLALGELVTVDIMRPLSATSDTLSVQIDQIGAAELKHDGSAETSWIRSMAPGVRSLRIELRAQAAGLVFVQATALSESYSSRTISIPEFVDFPVVGEVINNGVTSQPVSDQGTQPGDLGVDDKRCREGFSTPPGTGSVTGKCTKEYIAPPHLNINCGTPQKSYYYPTRCLKDPTDICVPTGTTSDLDVTRLDYVSSAPIAVGEGTTGESTSVSGSVDLVIVSVGGGEAISRATTSYTFIRCCIYAINPDETVPVKITNCLG